MRLPPVDLAGAVMGGFFFALSLARGMEKRASFSFTFLISSAIGAFAYFFHAAGELRKIGMSLFLIPFVIVGAVFAGSAFNRSCQDRASWRLGRLAIGALCALLPALVVFHMEHLPPVSAAALVVIALPPLLLGTFGRWDRPLPLFVLNSRLWRWLADGCAAYSKPGGIGITMHRSGGGQSGASSRPGGGGRSGGAGAGGTF